MITPQIERYYVTSALLLAYFNHGITAKYHQITLSRLKQKTQLTLNGLVPHQW